MRHLVPVLVTLLLLLLVAACGSERLAHSGYLPPCSPVEGSSSDPCEPDTTGLWETGGGEVSFEMLDEPRGLDYFLNVTDAHVSHLVVRATYLPGTLRCAITGDKFRPASYYTDPEDEWDFFTHTKAVKCYIDVRVNDYILGSGPTTLTILMWDEWYRYWIMEPHKEEELRVEYEQLYSEILSSPMEMILFIGPAVDTQVEVLQVMRTWDVKRRDDGTAVAVHPYGYIWKRVSPVDYQTYLSTLLEMEMSAFRQAVTAAHQARLTAHGGRAGPDPNWPMLETNANRLTEFYTAIGAYSHADGPPVKPTPACGLATSTGGYNSGLMQDCQALLAAKDSLRGTGTLNWSTGTAIASWDGVTTGGTPTRVTKLLLSNEGLTGNIPADLGDLPKLTHLNLSSNSLTGEIPREVGYLDSLEEVRLSGNSLTGCIPYGLKDVTTKDLASLNLLYCPPAPSVPTGGTVGETSIPLTWTAVASTTEYRIHYRRGINIILEPWSVDESTTGTTHTVDGLKCEKKYQFRVSAYGDGTTYAAAWSVPSELLATSKSGTL